MMLFEQIRKNKRDTWLILIGYILAIGSFGAILGYFMSRDMSGVMKVCLVLLGFTAIYATISVMFSTFVVMKMNHAVEITEQSQEPQLWNIVEDMALVAQVPMPRIFIINDPSPNAFASGMSPQTASVAVTTGLFEMLNREELEGVLAHEFTHIRSYDVRTATIAAALGAGVAAFFTSLLWMGESAMSFASDDDDDDGVSSFFFTFAIWVLSSISSFVLLLMQMMLSRKREYAADAAAVELTRNPQGLISALEKITYQSQPMESAAKETTNMYIANPFKRFDGEQEEQTHWWDDHPATKDRVARLRAM